MKNVYQVIMTTMMALVLSACTQSVAFEDLHYQLPSVEIKGHVGVVISQSTLDEVHSIHAFSTGAGKWDAEIGVMLKQVARYEYSHIFSEYDFATSRAELPEGDYDAYLVLTVPYYDFQDYHASLTIHADVYGAQNQSLFSDSYSASGRSGAAKMWVTGAWGMKSAVRESSVEAFRAAFQQLNEELEKNLQ